MESKENISIDITKLCNIFMAKAFMAAIIEITKLL